MLVKFGKVIFAMAIAAISSSAEAGIRYYPAYAGYSPAYVGYSPAYAAYSPAYAGYSPAYAAAYSPHAAYTPAVASTPALPANSPHAPLFAAAAANGHTAVVAPAADGKTPSVASYNAFGNFLGWWQLINGVVTFVDGATGGGGGGGGGGGAGTGVTSQQFADFVTQYKQDMSDIKIAIKSGAKGGAGPGTGPGETVGGAGAGGGVGTATPPPVAAAPAAPAAVPEITGSAVERAEKIIDKTTKIKFKK